MNRGTILVIREPGVFASIFEENGFEVISLPMIRTEPVTDLSELRAVVQRLNDYDALFFTSPHAADVFISATSEADASGAAGEVFVLGERARERFARTGFNIKFDREADTIRELIDSFGINYFEGKRILFVRGDKSLGTIPELLGKLAVVDEIVVYRTLQNDMDEVLISDVEHRLRSGQIEWICFFSPSAIDAFRRRFPEQLTPGQKVAVIGPTTAGAAETAWGTAAFISPRANERDFAAGLMEFIGNN